MVFVVLFFCLGKTFVFLVCGFCFYNKNKPKLKQQQQQQSKQTQIKNKKIDKQRTKTINKTQIYYFLSKTKNNIKTTKKMFFLFFLVFVFLNTNNK